MEGCGYRDLQDQFDALGIHIVGVSFDSPEKNQAWAEREGFEFELWTDTDKTLAVHYGAASSTSAFVPDRITKILDRNGDLVLEYLGVSVGTHPALVLEDCEKLFGP